MYLYPIGVFYEPAYLEAINAAGVGERVEFPQTRIN